MIAISLAGVTRGVLVLPVAVLDMRWRHVTFRLLRLITQPFKPLAPRRLILNFAQVILPDAQFSVHCCDHATRKIKYQVHWGNTLENQQAHGLERRCHGNCGSCVFRAVTVTQIASPIGRPKDQRATLIGLGLNKMDRTRELEDTPAVRGMIGKVRHLVRVEGES